MEQYRVYVLDAEGHVRAPPEVIECPDYRGRRVQHARQLLDGHAIEVWNFSRRIIAFAATRPSSPVVGLPKDDPK